MNNENQTQTETQTEPAQAAELVDGVATPAVAGGNGPKRPGETPEPTPNPAE